MELPASGGGSRLPDIRPHALRLRVIGALQVSGCPVALTGKIDLETPACDELPIDPSTILDETECDRAAKRVAIGG
jgi:hypothetical protein